MAVAAVGAALVLRHLVLDLGAQVDAVHSGDGDKEQVGQLLASGDECLTDLGSEQAPVLRVNGV